MGVSGGVAWSWLGRWRARGLVVARAAACSWRGVGGAWQWRSGSA
jgi:hypothetical protein